MFVLNIEVLDVYVILSSEMIKIKMVDILVCCLEFWWFVRCWFCICGLIEWYFIIGKVLYIVVNMREYYVNIFLVNILSIYKNYNKLYLYMIIIFLYRFLNKVCK